MVRLVIEQIDMNAVSLARLDQAAVERSTELWLEFTYIAPTRAAADQLVSCLRDNTSYEAQNRPRSRLRRGGEWLVEGRTQNTTVSHSRFSTTGFGGWLWPDGTRKIAGLMGGGTRPIVHAARSVRRRKSDSELTL